jgi:thiol-disulfide isomerase/thioredoxin
MKQGPWSVATVLAVILIAGGAGFYLASHRAGESTSSLGNRVSAAAAAAAAKAATQSPTPRRLPAITLPDLEGKPRSMSEWQGRPLLINFWATWCEPCLREIPLLGKLRARHAKEGLEVIGIAIDFRDAVAGYAKKAGITYPLLIAAEDATAPKAFGVGLGLPTTVVANESGQIVATHLGELDEAEAEKLLAAVLPAK